MCKTCKTFLAKTQQQAERTVNPRYSLSVSFLTQQIIQFIVENMMNRTKHRTRLCVANMKPIIKIDVEMFCFRCYPTIL